MAYYVVVNGRVPGIYTTWEEAKGHIFEFKGAAYRKFTTYPDAVSFYKRAQSPAMPPMADPVNIYTDGSYGRNAMGYGIVILGDHDIFHRSVNTICGRVPGIINLTGSSIMLGCSNNVAELYAIYKAIKLVNGPLVIHTDSMYAISALTIHHLSWEAKGWRGVCNKELIKHILCLMECRRIIFKYIRAHDGNEYNELADELANQGRVSESEYIVK